MDDDDGFNDDFNDNIENSNFNFEHNELNDY